VGGLGGVEKGKTNRTQKNHDGSERTPEKERREAWWGVGLNNEKKPNFNRSVRGCGEKATGGERTEEGKEG